MTQERGGIQPGPALSNSQGFALVATISIMTLLVLVALSMLSLSTITTRSSLGNAAEAEAKANARLALMLAIGELQKQLGPDQRISMTADQRMQSAGDGSATSAALGNRHWTGVYDSWLDDTDTRPEPKFRSWMISGNENLVSQAASADTGLAAANAVELVGQGTMGVSDRGMVRVPALDLAREGVKRGRMAWWVGDQGVKAALST
ncbi:MAG: hypothetical protein KJO79_08490, partial [Verrucomicrobiae bacterium]|nr:hypothetical protein [Verrucomicrobiae bacterium]NNJ87204.1 hypothetical protein [Akkermansiaceae bacterium]